MKNIKTFYFITAVAGIIIFVSACGTTGKYSDEGYLPRITEITRTQKDLLYNFLNMYNPHVLKEQLPGNEGYPYTMWFYGWATEIMNVNILGKPGGDSIFVARGKDLYTWEVYKGDGTWDTTMNPALWRPVVVPGSNPWDSMHASDPYVVKKDGIFYLMYSAAGFGLDMIYPYAPGDEDGDLMSIMGAVSTDGINWTKSEEAVLVWEQEKYMFSSQIHEWWLSHDDMDNFHGWYHRPSFMFDESISKWRMWFDYYGNSRFGITLGYAEADADADIMKASSWRIINADKNPMYANEFPNPDVIKIDNRYYCTTDPRVVTYGANPRLVPSDGFYRRQIMFFVSDDGYDWRPVGWITPDRDTQANQVAQFYYEDGILYVFYATMRWNDWMQDRIRVIEIKKEVFEKW